MNKKQNDYIDLKVLWMDFWVGVQKFWYAAIGILLITTVLYWGYQKMMFVPMYRAQASFTVKTTGAAYENEVTTSYSFNYDKNTASQIGTTFPYILNSDVFRSRLKSELGTTIINGSIVANVVENSNLVTLQVVSTIPEDAKKILDAVLVTYPEIAQYLIGNLRLDLLKEAEIDEKPYNSLNHRSVLLLGAEIGVGLSLLLLVLYAMLKKTIRQEADLKKIFNVPCLAQIPEIKGKKKNDILGYGVEQESYNENIYALQNRVDYLMKQDQMKVLVVTSTGPEEGKTTLSINLAIAMARRGKKVFLIDGDLRKPDLKKRLNVQKKTVSIQSIIKSKMISKDAIIPLEEQLFLLGNDSPAKYPLNVVQSKEMQTLIYKLKKNMDIIIIDTPPCGLMADAGCYSEYADGILYVVRQDWTDVRNVMNAVEELPEHGTKIMGCVLNRVRTGMIHYGGYGYGTYHYKRYNRYGKYKKTGEKE